MDNCEVTHKAVLWKARPLDLLGSEETPEAEAWIFQDASDTACKLVPYDRFI